jgi:Ca2+-binding EF-hand superfamily protein
MKTRILYTALAAFAVSSISASAQEGERPKREIPPEILAKFDTDGDGKLSEDERKAAMEARKGKMEEQRKAMIAKFDKDGDGKLDEEERKAAREAMKARHDEILAKYDADKDGKLSPEERKAAIDAGEKLPPMGPEARGGRDGKPGPDGKRGPGGPQGQRGPGGPKGQRGPGGAGQ